MRYLWSVYLVVLFVECSSSSRETGSGRRKNRLRAGLTITIRTLELQDLLNGSTTPTAAASTPFSSFGGPEVSKDKQPETHPDERTTTLEVFQFSNLTAAVEEDGREVASVDLNYGISTTKIFSQRKPSEINFKETIKRKAIALSSSSALSPTSSSSSSSSPDINVISEDAAITTATPTAISTISTAFRANVTEAHTAVKQQCPSEHAGDCLASFVASSRETSASVVAHNSHPVSSTSHSGLTQQPAASSPGAGLGGGKSATATTGRVACAPCDVRQCQPVFPESCQGLIRKDSCGCCPICTSYEDAGALMLLTTPVVSGSGGAGGGSVCASIRCPRGRVCLLNIQGLPMCRCPSVFQCRRLPDRPVCSTDGHTFKNRCFLSVDECIAARTLGIAHDGRCGAEMKTASSTNLQQQQQQPTPTPLSPAFRLHPPQILMSDERVRHQGYRVRNKIERNRHRFHRQQTPTRKHERKPTAGGATSDEQQSKAHAKRKSQGQRNSD